MNKTDKINVSKISEPSYIQGSLLLGKIRVDSGLMKLSQEKGKFSNAAR